MKSFLTFTLFAVVASSVVSGISSTAFAEGLQELAGNTSENQQPVDKEQLKLVAALEILLGRTTSHQEAFFRHIEQKEWRKALIQWGPAFKGTAFENSDNGKAMKGLLYYNNAMDVVGIEKLFEARNAKTISNEIVKAWRKALRPDTTVWSAAEIRWSPGFSDIFGEAAEVQSKLKDYDLKADTQKLKALSSSLNSNTKEKAIADWSLALSYALNDKADESAKVIAQILKNPKNPLSEDLLNVTAGRLLFQKGFFDAAIKYYEKVAKSSDYWFEAQEELAWTYLRKGETQNALATSRSLMNKSFSGMLGPEPYFVETLSQLKVCDYPKVIDGLKAFPKQFKNRAVELNLLAQGQKSEFIANAITRMVEKGTQWSALGEDSKVAPRDLVKDHKFTRMIDVQRQLTKEAATAQSLYADSMPLTGYQSTFQITKNDLDQRINKVKAAAGERMKGLAKTEVFEIKTILDKLHIVEAEVIQQVEVSDKVAKSGTGLGTEAKKGTTGSKSSDALIFTADSEMWFDEISNYKVDVNKGCQTIKR